MATKVEFLEFLSQKVVEQWEETKAPLLLSNIPTVVHTGLRISYKEVVGETSLKQFLGSASREAEAGFKVVTDPRIHALVGLIPKHEEYTFKSRLPVAPAEAKACVQSSEVMSNEQIVRQFLALVAKLPPDDVKKVVIPVEVLTQLMFGK